MIRGTIPFSMAGCPKQGSRWMG